MDTYLNHKALLGVTSAGEFGLALPSVLTNGLTLLTAGFFFGRILASFPIKHQQK